MTEIVELGHPFRPGMAHFPSHPGFEIALVRQHGDRIKDDGGSSASCELRLGGHTGTHVDALGHISAAGRLFDGSDAAEQQSRDGLRRGDAASLPPVIARGVLFDIPALRGVECLAPGDEVTAEELAEARQGDALATGDVALVRTGWGARWEREDYARPDTPGPGARAAEWLARRRPAAVGGDTAIFEHGPIASATPVHRRLLLDAAIPIMESLALEALAQRAPTRFTFVALPLRIVGGTGSPIRPVAMVDSSGG